MDEDDHRIFFARLHFRGREKPFLNIEAVVSPLEVLGLTPRWSLSRVVGGQLSPFTDWPGPNFGRRFIAASDRGREFAILGKCEGRKIAESVKAFGAFPDCPHGVVGERQFRDRAAAADIFREQDAIWRRPEEGTDRALATARAIYNIVSGGRDSEKVSTVESLIAHQAFNERAGFTIRRRSEEHTSELQSRPHLVCRILLEKKKKVSVYTYGLTINKSKYKNTDICSYI